MLLDEGYRFHVQFHITNQCNLCCKHCYEGHSSSRIEWDYDEFVTAIDKLWSCFHKWEVLGEISLIGGEPTMHPRFNDMVRYLHGRGDVHGISILTNGVRISPDFIQVAKENDCHIQVSIDGATAEGHDFIRGKGNYHRTLENSKRMADEGLSLSAHYVLSKYTIPIQEDLFFKLLDNGITQIAFSRLVPFGNASKNEMLSSDEMKNVFTWIEQMRQKYEPRGLYFGTTRPLWCLVGHEGKCPVAHQTITILEDGTILPCRRLPIPLGNIKTDSFYKVWYTSEILEDIRNRTHIDTCGSCAYLEKCGGARCIAYATTGDYMAKDPQCWLIEKQTIGKENSDDKAHSHQGEEHR